MCVVAGRRFGEGDYAGDQAPEWEGRAAHVESLDALVSLDTAAEGEGARVRVEEVGEFAGGREVAVEISVEAGPAASAAPARAVPNIAAGLLDLAADEVDERRVSGDRLGQMKAAASALDDVIRYAHRGDWLVGTCGRLVMGVYAPAEHAPEPGSGGRGWCRSRRPGRSATRSRSRG